MKVLFTYLVSFSGNGGIQKFNRCFIKALYELHINNEIVLSISSPYDRTVDIKYISEKLFIRGYNKVVFIFLTLVNAFQYDVIFIGHINVSIIGYLIKFFFPKKKIILIAHGIEVWRPLNRINKVMINKFDYVLSVSQYTKDLIQLNHGVKKEKILVFNNTVDPNLLYPKSFYKPKYLFERYGLKDTDKIILTIARLSNTEQYKGYDQVIYALGQLKDPNLVYLIGGKFDEDEKLRLDLIIKMNQLENNVFLTGYVNEFELIDHYLLADVFIMPSKKEGFGIVFIEAMACGLKVIAGNKDGSVDALKNGELGDLIDPDNLEEIKHSIIKAIQNPLNHAQKLALQGKVLGYFGFRAYKERLSHILKTI